MQATLRRYLQHKECKTANEWIDAFKDLGIRLIAFDFDLTITEVHSRGHIDFPTTTRSDSIEPILPIASDFCKLANAAENSNIKLAVVTFSDEMTAVCQHEKFLLPSGWTCLSGEPLVREVLKSCPDTSSLHIPHIIALFPLLRNELSPTSPFPLTKSYHLNRIKQLNDLSCKEILLIDDDFNNCKDAVCEGYAALHVSNGDGLTFSSLEPVNC